MNSDFIHNKSNSDLGSWQKLGDEALDWDRFDLWSGGQSFYSGRDADVAEGGGRAWPKKVKSAAYLLTEISSGDIDREREAAVNASAAIWD